MASLPFLPVASSAINHHPIFLFNPRPPLTLLSLRPRPPPPFRSSSSPSLQFLARVLTAPAECASPVPPEFDLREELLRLRNLRDVLSRSRSVSEKLRVIRKDSRVRRFFADYGEGAFRALRKAGMGKEEVYLVHCLVAGGQEHVLGSWGSGNERLGGGSRSAVKTALYSLVGMIERLEIATHGRLGTETREELEEEAEVGGLWRLLKVLREVESFYDCIGGVIG